MVTPLMLERTPALKWGTRALFTAAVLLMLSAFPTETATLAIDLPSLPIVQAAEVPVMAYTATSATTLPVRASATPAFAPAARVARKRSVLSKMMQGMASWYGAALENHRTASGRLFHSTELTAAHRSLPFGSKVRVTDLRNQKSVVVTITDRGELFADRVIDLSLGAAQALDMVKSGVDPVKLEVLGARAAAEEEARVAAVQ